MTRVMKVMAHRIKPTMTAIWDVLKTTGIRWFEMDPFRESAVIAYYAIFALPALLVIIITMAGALLGADAMDAKIYGQVSKSMGPETADQVREMLINATMSESSFWATLFGIITLLVGAIGVFVELQKTLNTIWSVEASQRKGIMGFLRSRVFSFGLILSIAFLLLVSLVVSTFLSAASELFHAESSSVLLSFFGIVNFVVSLSVISMMFAMMFKFLPDAKVTWQQVWLGALLTGVLFTLGKMVLAFYFTTADPGSRYGAAGSVILIMLWTAYSSLILFLGAHFTHAYAQKFYGEVAAKDTGKKVVPEAEPA